MAKNVGQDFDGVLIHFGSVRTRVTGSGNLRMFLNSLDDVHTNTLTPIAMQSSTNREPTVLANFIDQRASLEIKTTDINETFNISKIIVYVRPVATGYPQ